MKKIWKVTGSIGLAVLLVGAYAGYRLAFGKPFTINQLANRQALLILVDNPELFTQIGVVDGTVLDWHSGKLTAVGVPGCTPKVGPASRPSLTWFPRQA